MSGTKEKLQTLENLFAHIWWVDKIIASLVFWKMLCKFFHDILIWVLILHAPAWIFVHMRYFAPVIHRREKIIANVRNDIGGHSVSIEKRRQAACGHAWLIETGQRGCPCASLAKSGVYWTTVFIHIYLCMHTVYSWLISSGIYIRVCLVGEKFGIWYCSTFRCYLTNNV